VSDSINKRVWFQALVAIGICDVEDLIKSIEQLTMRHLAEISVKEVLDISLGKIKRPLNELIVADKLIHRLALCGLIEPRDIARYCWKGNIDSPFMKKIKAHLEILREAKKNR